MIEFKRAGDLMVFTCPVFKIEVAGNEAERIDFNDERFSSIDAVTDAFKVLDMMLEHKARQTTALSADINTCDGINADIEALKRRMADSNNLRCVVGD